MLSYGPQETKQEVISKYLFGKLAIMCLINVMNLLLLFILIKIMRRESTATVIGSTGTKIRMGGLKKQRK